MGLPGGYKIDHRALFLSGFLFYFLTPIIAGKLVLFEGFPGIALYQGFFERIAPEKIDLYLFITVSWIPAFFLGHFLFSCIAPGKVVLKKFPLTSTATMMPVVAISLFLVLLIFTYLSRASIFGGYGSYDIAARGKMSTLLVLYNFFLAYTLVTKGLRSPLLNIGVAATAFLLLTMGGRMYVFQTFILLLVFKTSFAEKKWKVWQIAIFAFAGFMIGGAFGIWRMGASLNFQRALYSFFGEPVFTWFSTSSFLIHNDLPMISFPANFLTSFFNVIPNTFISLQSFVVSTHSMVKGYESPLGADSLWSNVMINFGIIGSFIFFFLTGFLLNFLKKISQHSRFWAIYYLMVCTMLPFQLFRDGFYILHKQLYFNFLLLPALILFSLKMLLYIQSTSTTTTELKLNNNTRL